MVFHAFAEHAYSVTSHISVSIMFLIMTIRHKENCSPYVFAASTIRSSNPHLAPMWKLRVRSPDLHKFAYMLFFRTGWSACAIWGCIRFKLKAKNKWTSSQGRTDTEETGPWNPHDLTLQLHNQLRNWCELTQMLCAHSLLPCEYYGADSLEISNPNGSKEKECLRTLWASQLRGHLLILSRRRVSRVILHKVTCLLERSSLFSL